MSDLTSHAAEAFKDAVFRDVWVQVEQRVAGGAVMRCDPEEVNDVGQTDEGQLLLGVRLHSVHPCSYRGSRSSKYWETPLCDCKNVPTVTYDRRRAQPS